MYLEPATSSCDEILIDASVDTLCAQNVLTYGEMVDIILADSQTKKKLLEDKIISLSTSKYVQFHNLILFNIL